MCQVLGFTPFIPLPKQVTTTTTMTTTATTYRRLGMGEHSCDPSIWREGRGAGIKGSFAYIVSSRPVCGTECGSLTCALSTTNSHTYAHKHTHSPPQTHKPTCKTHKRLLLSSLRRTHTHRRPWRQAQAHNGHRHNFPAQRKTHADTRQEDLWQVLLASEAASSLLACLSSETWVTG